MGLGQLYLIGGRNKVDEAIERIRQHEPPEGYTIAFGGGKDSIVLMDLARKSGVKFDTHYCRTGVDPPELVIFIRENYPEAVAVPPVMTMWEGILIHGLPLRQRRWCCQLLKEHAGNGRVILQGVRWSESARRRRRWDIFSAYDPKRGSKVRGIMKWFCNPIVDWTDGDIWEYIRLNELKYCCLYDEGFKRLGCVLCPFSSGEGLMREISRYPRFVDAYRRAANRYYDRRGAENMSSWSSGDDYFNWWLKERLGKYQININRGD